MIKLYYKNTYIGEVNTDLEFGSVKDMLSVLHLPQQELSALLNEDITSLDNFRMVKTTGDVFMNYYSVSQPDYHVKCEKIVNTLLHIKQYCVAFNDENDYTRRHQISNLIMEALSILRLLEVRIELDEVKVKNRKYYSKITAYANSKQYVIKIYNTY